MTKTAQEIKTQETNDAPEDAPDDASSFLFVQCGNSQEDSEKQV